MSIFLYRVYIVFKNVLNVLESIRERKIRRSIKKWKNVNNYIYYRIDYYIWNVCILYSVLGMCIVGRC